MHMYKCMYVRPYRHTWIWLSTDNIDGWLLRRNVMLIHFGGHLRGRLSTGRGLYRYHGTFTLEWSETVACRERAVARQQATDHKRNKTFRF